MESKINWPDTKLYPIVNVVMVKCQNKLYEFLRHNKYEQIRLKGVTCFIMLYDTASLETRQPPPL